MSGTAAMSASDGLNPANLRWFYLVQGLLDDPETSSEEKSKLERCVISLNRYPLALKSLEHCKILQHFTAGIVEKLKKRERSNDLDFGVSPISTGGRRQSPVVDLTLNDQDDLEDSDAILGFPGDNMQEVSRQSAVFEELQKRREQEESDYKMALALSRMEDDEEVQIVSENRNGDLNPICCSSDEERLIDSQTEELAMAPPLSFSSDRESDRDQSFLRISDRDQGGEEDGFQPITGPSPTDTLRCHALFSQDPVFNRNQQESSSIATKPNQVEKPSDECSASEGPSQRKRKRATTATTRGEYVPKPGSGGHAILLALSSQSKRLDYVGYMSKKDLVDAAEPLSTTSMKFSETSGFYTGWSSASLLRKKGLIEMWGNPIKIRLTEKGMGLAKRIESDRAEAEADLNSQSLSSRSSSSEGPSGSRREKSTTGADAFDDTASWMNAVDPDPKNPNFVMKRFPGDWGVCPDSDNDEDPSADDVELGRYGVVLMVDCMEVTGGSAGGKQSRKAITTEELESLGVEYETRRLPIGDFVWIARNDRGNELVLPFVVERKRMDDLRSSIMDGRYKEQKQRLASCGLGNKFYLVEDICMKVSNGDRRAIDRNVLEQAISNTTVRDGFNIKRCKSQKDSMKFLATFTRILREKFSSGVPKGLMTFKQFYEASRPDKPLTVREIFCNMLICLKGLSPAMAWAVTDRYGTPAVLKGAYDRCQSQEERESLLEGVLSPGSTRKAVSKTIAWLYNDSKLN